MIGVRYADSMAVRKAGYRAGSCEALMRAALETPKYCIGPLHAYYKLASGN